MRYVYLVFINIFARARAHVVSFAAINQITRAKVRAISASSFSQNNHISLHCKVVVTFERLFDRSLSLCPYISLR